MEIEGRRARLYAAVSGFLVLLAYNLNHYSVALLGFRLRLDPDYPLEFRFFPRYIADSILEYRTYILLIPWSAFLVCYWQLDPVAVCLIAIIWYIASVRRAMHYRSAFAFWKQAYKESPNKSRCQTRYAEELMKEIERRFKAGERWEDLSELIREAELVQHRIVRQGRKQQIDAFIKKAREQ